jgi:superfamily II RNA helicase
MIKGIKAEQTQLRTRLDGLTISVEEMVALVECYAIQTEIRETVNAKRRKAELALNRWKDQHTGPKWFHAEQRYNDAKNITAKLELLENDLNTALDVSCDVKSRMKVLESAGYLTSTGKLTTLGILATEINEATPLLMSRFYLSDIAKKMEPKEILAVLASCIVEGKKKEDEPMVDELDVPETVKSSLYTLNTIWNDICKIEHDLRSAPSEWPLGTFWIGPMWRWMEGESVGVLCAEYGIYVEIL